MNSTFPPDANGASTELPDGHAPYDAFMGRKPPWLLQPSENPAFAISRHGITEPNGFNKTARGVAYLFLASMSVPWAYFDHC